MDGVQGYNEDKIALVAPDLLNVAARILIILGTPIISHIINVMKEREIDALGTPWTNAQVAHLLSVQKAAATVEDDQATEESGSGEYNEVVFTKNMETVDVFSSHVIPIKAEKAYIGEYINIMTQAPYTQTLKKKTLVARAVAATAVPELLAETRLPEGADKPEGPHMPKLTIRQKQGKLFKELDLSGLELWPLELADST